MLEVSQVLAEEAMARYLGGGGLRLETQKGLLEGIEVSQCVDGV